MTELTPTSPSHTRDEVESPIWAAVLLASLLVLMRIGVLMNQHGKGNAVFNTILGVIMTLGIFSILYKENPVFRFCEHIFIGLATGYGAVYLWVTVIIPRWWVPMTPPAHHKMAATAAVGQGHWWMIFCLLLALLFYTVYFQKLAWMNRFLLSMLMGYFAGASFQAFMGLIAPQVTAAFRPPVTSYNPITAPGHWNNFHLGHLYFHPWWLISAIVLICSFAYFFFSVEHRVHFIRVPARFGRYFLMISLGAIFGTTVMGRFSLLIARLNYLLKACGMFSHSIAMWFHHVVK